MTIFSLHVYPIKGGAAVDVEALDIDPTGLIENDRSMMLVDTETGRFVSQRQVPTLARLRTRLGPTVSVSFDSESIDFDTTPHGPARPVTVWDDTFEAIEFDDHVSRWIAGRLCRDVRLVSLGNARRLVDDFWTGGRPTRTSFADLAPALLTNTASLDDLNRRRSSVGLAAVPMDRFRPNIVVRHDEPFAEDDWSTLQVGDVRLDCIKPCARCEVTQIDQTRGEPLNDQVLKTLAPYRTYRNRRGTQGIWFGQNVCFDPMAGGRLRVGDVVTFLS